MSIDAVLFDLDGTLVDTAPDLVAVLNRLLRECGLAPAPFAMARNEVSNGAAGLIRLGFGADLPAERYEALRARFLEIYSGMICIESKPFFDIEVLLQAAGTSIWGVVTNKPHLMTLPLLTELNLTARSACIISGDRLPQKKPHPAPLLLAAEEIGVPASRCAYVGDAVRDIEAGRAAGMATIAAGYGYIHPGEDIGRWGANLIVRHANQLAGAIRELDAAETHDAA